MIWHDYLTSISCDICSDELSVQKNLGEKKMRQYAGKRGWRIIDGKDVCPYCAEKEANHNGNRSKRDS